VKANFQILLYLTFLFSCTDQKQETASAASSKKVKEFPFFQDQDETFRKWNDYHLDHNSGFQNMGFTVSKPIKTEFTRGTIYATFDKEFDKTYLPFLVYSPNKEKYIDFNSYHWTLVDGEPQFEIDQEINLADIKHKTVLRIAFCGSEELVEDVYWQDDQTVVLLKMTNGNTPQVTIIDLKTQISASYSSVYKSDSPSEYSRVKIRSGIKKDLSLILKLRQ
jgi:hypothetical protein